MSGYNLRSHLFFFIYSFFSCCSLCFIWFYFCLKNYGNNENWIVGTLREYCALLAALRRAGNIIITFCIYRSKGYKRISIFIVRARIISEISFLFARHLWLYGSSFWIDLSCVNCIYVYQGCVRWTFKKKIA